MKNRFIKNCCFLAMAAGIVFSGCASLDKGNVPEPSLVQIDANTWCIDDKGANIYIVLGSEKALIIDTGYGSFDPKPILRKITNLPVIVANTHYHHDHTSGNKYFKEVCANPADLILYNRIYNAIYSVKTIPIKDGETINLGDRTISVLLTPGHSAGSLCFFDEKSNMLFSGDVCNNQVWLFFEDSTTVATYLETLRRLDAISSPTIRMLPGHGEPVDKSVITKQLRCAENVLAGEKGTKDDTEGHGGGLKYTYENASLVYDPKRIR